ncbi:MAG: hypothetical protein ACO1RX_19510 [Candidatus Sericytochromatia bacterium]
MPKKTTPAASSAPAKAPAKTAAKPAAKTTAKPAAPSTSQAQADVASGQVTARKAKAPAASQAATTPEKLSKPDSQPSLEQNFEAAEKALTDWMIAHPREVIKHRQQFMQQLIKRRCSYGDGGILPVTLAPMFLKQASVDRIAKAATDLDKILDKAVNLYFTDDYVKSYFPYPDIPVEWINWDPKYSKPTILNRHDALYDGKNLKFIEFNTDNPGGRGWLDTYEDLLIKSPLYKDLIAEYCQTSDRPMLHALKESLLSCYREWGGTKKNPRVALVSFKDFLAGSDSEIVRDYLIEHGIEANFIDPREFEYRDGKLYSGNVQFDIVNMCLRFTFFKRYPREMQDFMNALRDGAVCQVNHFRATLGSQKEMLSFLSNEDNHHYFTETEAQCIKDHIPWTRKMDETITLSQTGRDISLQDYVVKNREDLVLKPTWAAGGFDVYVGKFTDKDKWQSVVEGALGCPWWIVQEAVEIPEYEFPVIRDSQVVMEKKNLNLNPYVFNGEYVGCLGRISESKVINVSAGGGIIPVFALKGEKAKK